MSDDSPSQGPAPVRAGEILAEKYEVERVLGSGGMGIVVSAHHVHLKQRVALKLLLPELATNGEVVARFVREAQSASTIRSEHVVRVTDVAILPNGAPYMVMEYLEGKDLAHVLFGRGRLPVGVAVDYLLQAMEALAEAHHAGIVHRDLKPSNLFLTERADGSPLIKVLDFGISKVTRTGGEQSSKSLTRTAGLIGSPLYMSPEQIRSSKNVDARSDVWSLGVILYELLSGKTPFSGEEMNGVLASIVADEPVPLRQVQGDVPRELDAVVMKCLAKKPEARYAGVGPLARALAPFGSQAAALSVERVVGVSQRRPAAGSEATLPSPVVAAAGTAGAWTHRSPSVASRPKRRLVIAAALVGLVAVAAAFLIHKNQPAGASSSATVEPPAPATAEPNPTQPLAPVTAAAPPTPTVSPSTAIPDPAASASAPKPPATAPPKPSDRSLTLHKRVPPPVAPKPPPASTKKPPNVGDLIDERR